MKKKYKSDAFQAIHESAVSSHKVGAMDAEEMEWFDKACLVREEQSPADEHPARIRGAGELHGAYAAHG
jgi:putative transcriptional regulator